MTNYIVCVQLPNNLVKYYTASNTRPLYISYYKFIDEVVIPLNIYQVEDFIDHLNKFLYLYIDVDGKKWDMIPKEELHASFEELCALNAKEKEDEVDPITMLKDKLSAKVSKYSTKIHGQRKW